MTTRQVTAADPESARRTADTLPGLLLERARATPEGDALRHKQLGIWQSLSWSALAERVEAVAAGLDGLGVGRGDVVVVVSDNRPEWVVAELAAQSLQASVVGPHPECGAEELRGLLQGTGARVLVVEDQRQLDKVEQSRAEVADLAVVCCDVRGVHVGDGTGVRAFTALEERGRAAAQPGWWRDRVETGAGSDVAVLCLPARASATPQDLAAPRTVALTHAGLLAAAASLPLGDTAASRRYVSVLPLGWSWEQVAGVTAGVRDGFALSFPERSSTQLSDLRDIGPDVLLAPARAWEAMAADLETAAADAGRLRGAALRWARGQGRRRADGGGGGLGGRLADALVLRTVRDRVGLSRTERAWAFGAPLREDVQAYFASLGVDLRPLYGADAAGGPVAAQTSGRAVPGAVGTALPGVELQLSADGEVLVRSAAVPTDQLAADGWLHTGDRAREVDGQLVLVGRGSDVLVVGDGQVSPDLVEAELRASPYLEDVVVLPSDSRAALSALVVLEPAAVAAWAEQHRLHAPSYEALTRLPEVEDLVRGELARLARTLPAGAAVRRCVVLPRRLDPDLGEVTRTLVVRRRVVLHHFPAEVTALGGAPASPAAAPVRVLDVPEGPA